MVQAKQGAAQYRVEIVAAGHALVGDEPAGNGGQNAGPGPFDLVLSGLAACTLITLRMYAERKGWAGFDISARLRHRMEERVHVIDREVEVNGVPDAGGLDRLRGARRSPWRSSRASPYRRL